MLRLLYKYRETNFVIKANELSTEIILFLLKMPTKHLTYCLIFLLVNTIGYCQTNIGGVVNIYKQVISIDSQSCSSLIEVDNTTGLSVGEQIIVMQMKGAILNESNTKDFGSVIDYNGAGNYEIVTINSLSANHITTNKLSRQYDVKNGKVQVISFSKYTDAEATTTIRAEAWNGKVGGVVALNVSGSLSLKADIDVSGQGFRGGSISNNPDGGCGNGSTDYYYPLNQSGSFWEKGGAEKGESISTLANDKNAGKGAAANGGGGGNKHNYGGGGGGNFTSGGKGGDALQECATSTNNGGEGGWQLTPKWNRLFLGGGGGCGDDNNQVGTFGASGGGIIIILASEIIGNGYFIKANGASQNAVAHGIADGAGGGGGGGSIFLDVKSFTTTLNVEVNGGNGGNQNPDFGCVGPGGGGGCGIVMSCNKAIPSTVNILNEAGKAGVILNSSLSQCANSTYGATDGISSSLRYLILDTCLNFTGAASTSSSNTYDADICAGDSLTLKPKNAGTNYLWSDGSTGDTLLVTSPGKYWVKKITPANCIETDTINVYLVPDFLIDLGNDTTVCKGITFKLNINTQLDVQWENGSTDFYREINTAGLYSVNVSNGCDSKRDSILIEFEECSCYVFMPSAFTPNGDGLNDDFKPTIDCPIVGYSMLIFNRWGEVIFKTTDAHQGWDGFYKGKKAPEGVYAYIVDYIYPRARKVISGNITLLKSD